ncbi:40S ribosomal protein S6-like [Artibeus jamaicensis]|uniref:40S ribosomal protein S6-like n=1 Tax=Artibeus jamaicensis TaxID=9417 RepID=UPI00235ACE59|nr:40S ribosomal protein S6-like [Artibeus jamaicensis]
MKLSLTFPASGCQKLTKVDNVRKCCAFYENHAAMGVSADALGEEQKGYVVRISGGNNKQGFPTKQGDFTHGRVCLLLSKGHSCQQPGGTGERECASIHLGKGIPGLTDTAMPRHLESKRASKIHKPSSFSKEDSVHQYGVKKPLNKDGDEPRTKAPKIQWFVAPCIQQHKCQRIALKKQCTKKNKREVTEDAKFLAKRMKEAKEKYQELIAKRHRPLSLRASTSV